MYFNIAVRDINFFAPMHAELTSVTLDVGKGGGGPEPIISSRWARDEDINRMIR